MAKSFWTVEPTTVRRLGEHKGRGFWLAVKQRLTEGESRRVSTAGFKGMSGFGQQAAKAGEPSQTELGIDWVSQAYVRFLTWVVDWDLSDDLGNKLSLNRSTLESMDPDAFASLEKVINAHVEELEREKKVQSSEHEPSPTSV